MKQWFLSILEDITCFFVLWDRKELYWFKSSKRGFLVEVKGKQPYYFIHNYQGALISIEKYQYHNYIVRQMKRVGVPVIPFAKGSDARSPDQLVELSKEYSFNKDKAEGV